MVYVLGQNGMPLMPCANVIARLLLKQGKAKVIHRTPFTIELNYETEIDFKQELVLGIDTGSTIIGSAVVSTDGNVVYAAEVIIRNDISKKMKKRAVYRRNRRNRNTRYRAPRFLNRGNSIRNDRFSPTMKSKIDSHLKEIAYVNSILPISKLILETGNFDPHALKNPEVFKKPELYQKGTNFGFANTKAFVLDRDGYLCQNCKGKSKNSSLHVHHVKYKSKGGSDAEDNLITLCKSCHIGVHAGIIDLKKNGKKRGQLRHATQMNSIRCQLLKQLPDAVETFGYITKEVRQSIELEKSHANDAISIAGQGILPKILVKTLFKCCVSDGDYQLYKGVRSEQKIPSGKICGFRKFDKVSYCGKNYFVKGRMSTGYAILMGIDNEKIDLLPVPKFSKMRRIGARKSWIMNQETIVNIN